MESSNNATFIYQYTEKSLQSINKSIDIATDKLTKILAFSGVLLKFGNDMSSEGYFFTIKFAVLACLVGAIGFCATGLFPRSPGNTSVKPEYLLEEQYGLTDEEIHVLITRSWIEEMPKLKELRDYRLNLLNYAIGSLVLSGILFAMSGIIGGIK